MFNDWKEVFTRFEKMKNQVMVTEDNKKLFIDEETFINHFILQMCVLWVLQKHYFFNNDQEYFLTVFQSLNDNSASFPYNLFSSFIVDFMKNLKDLGDYHIEGKSIFGVLRGCSSAIFLSETNYEAIRNLPNSFFSVLPNHTQEAENQNTNEGILDILDRISFEIDGFFLGSLYEWLITADRKRRSGIYYTPREIASYISRNSIKYWLNDRFNDIFDNSGEEGCYSLKALDMNQLIKIFQTLTSLTILDPAVGTGHFLESAINELLILYSDIWGQFRDLTSSSNNIQKESLSNNVINKLDILNSQEISHFELIILSQIIFPQTIYGVDISKSVIAFTKARCFLIISKRLNKSISEPYSILQFKHNLISADALLTDWKSIYANLFKARKGFSIILTNPPYIGESDNKELFRTYARRFVDYYEGKIDIWYLFFHLSLDLLEPEGIVTILASSYWLTASGAAKLRKRVMHDTYIVEYINFGSNQVFESAQGVHTNLITVKKLKKANPYVKSVVYNQKLNSGLNLIENMPSQLKFQINQKNLTLDNWDDYFHFCPPDVLSALRKIIKNATQLGKTDFYVKEGLITGLNRITRHQVRKYEYPKTWINNGVFILDSNNPGDQAVIDSFSTKDKNHIKLLYKNSDILRYSTRLQTSRYLLYMHRNEVDLTKTPNIANHLAVYQKALKNSLDNPPFINRPRQKHIFLSPKVVVPQKSREIRFGYNETEWYAGQDVYYILQGESSKASLKNLLAVFHSKLAFFWFSWMGKKKGLQFEFFGESLSYFPVPKGLSNDVQLTKVVDYLIFLYSLQDITSNYIQIRKYLDEIIVNILVYEQYVLNKLKNLPYLAKALLEVREILEQSVREINLEHFLKTRYQLLNSNDSKVRTEYEEIKNLNLQIIDQSYQYLKSNSSILQIYRQICGIPVIKLIENFYKGA